MQHAEFVHLHIHTQYSLLDGAIRIEDLCARAREFKMPAVAITDHGNLFGAIEFYSKAIEMGVKPLIGCEVYFQSEGSRLSREIRRGYEPYHHLILIVMNKEGYQNLCRMITSSYLEGFYYKPRIDKEILEKHSEGIIATSACLKGEVARHILAGNIAGAERAIEYYSKVFPERFYLEIEANGLADQLKVNDCVKDLSKRLSIPLVATNDAHYLDRKDAAAHDALLCIQTGKMLKDEDRMRFNTDELYLKSPQEMAEAFKDVPEALSNTVEIARRCNLEIDFKTYHFPKYTPPEGEGLEEHLDKITWKGFEDRWGHISKRLKEEEVASARVTYEERLKEELGMIKKMGFAGYFLIVADFINHAKEKGIPVGPGRGSAAGSLVAYSLKITDIDPIPYNLFFERFLNPERISMPDMDIDFCMAKRDEVIRYVQEKYGDVSQIITFGKMKARAVVRDVGRVMNIPYGEVDRIAKLIPGAIGITLDQAVKVEPRLQELEQNDPQIARLLSIARSLEGLTRHASTHAAGVVISDQPLTNFMPLYKGQKDEIVTQYDMKSIEKIGLIKFDFLGLKTLTVIDQALKIIKRTRNENVILDELPLNDPEVYRILSNADTMGVFQLESMGMRDLMVKLKATAFEDLIALVALYRPGPLGSGMVDDFIKRKHGHGSVKYELPELKDVLEDTYGVIVYQEQVMRIASKLASFSMGDADILRRAMGKKKPDEMDEQKDKFEKGCRQNKIPAKKAEKIFNLMAKFAEYGFNKSHSTAYAMIAYYTAYLKSHYTTEFMAALLTQEMGNTDKVMIYIQDCREHGISVLPPDVNESYTGFSVVGEKEIRFGLAAVKNVGEVAIDQIIEARRKAGKFTSLMHFCENIDGRRVNRRVIESLIKCGGFDSMGVKRAQAMEGLSQVLDRASLHQKDRISSQESLFGMMKDVREPVALPDLPEWTTKEFLANEKESLGFYITGHPLAEYQDKLKSLTKYDTTTIKEASDGSDVSLGGVVAGLREITTKNGERMAFVTLEDLKGTVQVIVFTDIYKRAVTLIHSDQPVFVRGQVDVGEENVKVLAREIVSLKSIPDNAATGFHIRISSSRVSKDQFENLKDILRRYKGLCPTYVHLIAPERGETVLSLPQDFHVRPSDELTRSVDQLFGAHVTSYQ